MAAQDLFRAGCRWRVGTGLSIRVWSDPWLPRPRSFKPITPAPASMEYMRVSDFIDPHSHEWDMTKIRQFLRPIDSDLILGIPLSQTGEQDVLIWHYSRNGVFSVRSAYHLACSLDDRPCSSSLRHNEQVWWRKLWQMKLPCKVQVFIWRACLNALPTGMNLSKRLQGFVAVCPFCQSSEEDVSHTLVLCPFARQVWGLTPLHLPLIPTVVGSFWDWLQAVSSQLDGTELRHALASSPLGFIKINFDGVTFSGNDGLWGGGGGGVIAQDNWAVLGWLAKRFDGVGDGELAEAEAAREAVLLALRRGWNSVIFEGDCATLIGKLQLSGRDLSVLGPIITDIHSWVPYFQSVSFLFVNRHCDVVAHALAKLASSFVEGGSVVPPAIAPIVYADIST
ncbi:UNVERIFIED_CONTAM: hypothetical protein Scaly_2921700 [Sesamum calycinum]|uniref:Reverse transcriptase zinc-binding domain-containing protein n=1 Tax=Sesamum calycinum TaxID=2727403 RepID=A0AAW2KXE5_9LAMI